MMSAVGLILVKQHLQIAHAAQDLAVQAMIDSAEDYVERYCGIKLASDEFEEDLDGGELTLRPTFLPIAEIDEVTDNWDSDAEQDAAIHRADIRMADDAGEIVDVIWPAGKARWHAAYTAGYAVLPPALQLAVLQLVFRAYVQRGGETENIAAGVTLQWGKIADSGINELLRPFRQRVCDVV